MRKVEVKDEKSLLVLNKIIDAYYNVDEQESDNIPYFVLGKKYIINNKFRSCNMKHIREDNIYYEILHYEAFKLYIYIKEEVVLKQIKKINFHSNNFIKSC
jgi:hypothetical protein